MDIPVVSVASLGGSERERSASAARIGAACRDHGFFYAIDHDVDEQLIAELDQLAREFFARPLDDKMQIRMQLGGRAWRGYFPVGAELTSGIPDQKEGVYFGSELPDNDPRVQSRRPLHGANLFPAIDGFRDVVLQYLDALHNLGDQLIRGVALSLSLPENALVDEFTDDPTLLFRIFHYPPLVGASESSDEHWSVGEHTDYGLLTILRQDEVGGLQVKSRGKWTEAPPVANSFVCNIGDILDLLTGGLYVSTPHRVRNVSQRNRLSMPFFFDPNWDAELRPLENVENHQRTVRWDGEDIGRLRGTYGEYLLQKVARVFPELAAEQQ